VRRREHWHFPIPRFQLARICRQSKAPGVSSAFARSRLPLRDPFRRPSSMGRESIESILWPLRYGDSPRLRLSGTDERQLRARARAWAAQPCNRPGVVRSARDLVDAAEDAHGAREGAISSDPQLPARVEPSYDQAPVRGDRRAVLHACVGNDDRQQPEHRNKSNQNI
jgi:hypothetical protein